MATSFDFAPADHRRLVLTPWPLFLLGGLVVALLVTMQWLRHDLQSAKRILAQRQQEQAGRIAAIEAELPRYALDLQRLAALEGRLAAHHRLLGGPRRSFARVLLDLAACLPDAAVIAAIENPGNGRPLFAPTDDRWKLQVVVLDQETATDFYQRLSACGRFESVGMNPKGMVDFQGRHGIALEVTLKLAGGEA